MELWDTPYNISNKSLKEEPTLETSSEKIIMNNI